jgi:hypothetical protein
VAPDSSLGFSGRRNTPGYEGVDDYPFLQPNVAELIQPFWAAWQV